MNDFYSSFVSIHYIICECGDTFSTEQSLQKHLENEHDGPERNEYQCTTCDRIFKSKQGCIIHQQTHIPAAFRQRREPRPQDSTKPKKRYYNSKNIVCEVCGRKYASNAALRYHQRVHTGERPYHCPMCPKTFTMPLFLQIHIRTHTGERPYECPLCPKAFSNKAALLRHDRVHTGVKPYECLQCGKFFTQSNSMKLHVKTVHLKMPAPYKSKNRRAKENQRNLEMMAAAKEAPVKIAVSEPAAGRKPKASRQVRVKREPQPQQAVQVQECQQEEEYKEVYTPKEEGLYEQVKIEITEMYEEGIGESEEGIEESEVVYEEVYETEEEVLETVQSV